MKKKSLFIIFVLIMILAFILRFYKLGSLLPLFGDEVDIGYNSYSLLETGKDVTGHFFPIYFKTLIDTKSSLLTYLTTIPIFLFGLNEISLRLIPALAGVLMTWLIFSLVLGFSANKMAALISAFLMAVTPWAIHFSRGVWEANLMLFLLLLGIWAFLKSSDNKNYFYLSAFSFGLSFYAYHSAKVLTPLIILGLFFFFKDYFKKIHGKTLLLSLIIFLLVSLPNFYAFVFSGGQQRFSETSLFKDDKIIDQIVTKRQADQNLPLTGRFFHNKGEAYFNQLVGHYLESFSPQFLFLHGDLNFRHSSGEMGELYLLYLPFLLLGIFLFLKERKRYQNFLIYLLLIAPLPSIITQDGGQHAIRLLFLMPILLIITAFGFTQFYFWLKKNLPKKNLRLTVWFIIILFFLFNFTFYVHQYFWHYPKESWRYWAYGYKEIMLELKQDQNGYQKVFLNNNYEPSILWFLFWNEYPPQKFQQEFSGGKIEENILPGWAGFRVDKFYFGHLTDEEKNHGGILGFINENKGSLFLITQEKEIGGDWDWEKNPPQGIKVLKTVRDPYQRPIFYLVAHE